MQPAAATSSTTAIALIERRLRQPAGEARAEQRAGDRRGAADEDHVGVGRRVGEVRERAGDADEDADRHVGPDRALRRLADPAQQRRHPQRAEDQADEPAEQPDHRAARRQPRGRRARRRRPRRGRGSTGCAAGRSPDWSSTAAMTSSSRVRASRRLGSRPPPRRRSRAAPSKPQPPVDPAGAHVHDAPRSVAAIAEIARFAPPPAAAEEATSSVAGSRRLPSTSPTRPPASATSEAPDGKEREVHLSRGRRRRSLRPG